MSCCVRGDIFDEVGRWGSRWGWRCDRLGRSCLSFSLEGREGYRIHAIDFLQFLDGVKVNVEAHTRDTRTSSELAAAVRVASSTSSELKMTETSYVVAINERVRRLEASVATQALRVLSTFALVKLSARLVSSMGP